MNKVGCEANNLQNTEIMDVVFCVLISENKYKSYLLVEQLLRVLNLIWAEYIF